MKMLQFSEFQANVMEWAAARKIYKNGTSIAQLLKAVSEMGELADAHAKNKREDKIDAVGDVLVCLVNYCYMEDIPMGQAMGQAWNEIKNRKGYMSETGVFVKNEEN